MISSREWIGIAVFGFLLGVVAITVANSLESEKAALVLLWPGFFLQEIAGVGGHDEGGLFLLYLGHFLFYGGVVLIVVVAIKAWRGRGTTYRGPFRPLN